MAIFNELQRLKTVPGRYDCDRCIRAYLVHRSVGVCFIDPVAQPNLPTVQADEPLGFLVPK